MYAKPKKLLSRIIILMILTIFNIMLLAFLTSTGPSGLVVGLILTIINAFFLVFVLVVTFINLIKSISSKEESHTGIHLLNFVLCLLFTILFGFFYFIIIAGVIVILLPFL